MASRAKPPRLIVNLKAYPETLGRKAVALSMAARKLDAELGLGIAVCPQPVDLRACVDTKARVFAQHFDRLLRPEATGWQGLDAIVDAGVEGTLLNHSEHRLAPNDVPAYVAAARAAKVTSVLCTRDSHESGVYAATQPDLVAVEPPELIGGNVSVTTADPQVVSRSVEAVRNASSKTLVLCGAGIKTAKDVAKAVELGAYGILVASGVTKSKDPAKAIADLASGFGR